MATRLFSKKNNNIILVNHHDQPISEVSKLMGHRFGMLHRAYSILIFRVRKNKLETLLQQRSIRKYHCGGLWTNTCCSHPHPHEILLSSAQNRLFNEMGFEVPLIEVGKFHYIAKFDNGMTENEIDHVLIGVFNSNNIYPNSKEVQNYKWVEVGSLKNQIKKRPRSYTPWLYQALKIALKNKNKIKKLMP